MYGDSITWRVSENMGVWDRYLGSLGGPSAPLGIIFNQVSDLAYRIMNGDERFDLAPKAVVRIAGEALAGGWVWRHAECAASADMWELGGPWQRGWGTAARECCARPSPPGGAHLPHASHLGALLAWPRPLPTTHRRC